jgi:hypothetical protein
MGVRPREIHVKIGELILHGVAPADAAAVGDAAERELTRLFSEGGVPDGVAGGLVVGHVDAGMLDRGLEMGKPSMGSQIARAVYSGMSR